MGILDKLSQSVTGGVGRLIKGKIKSTIRNLIKEERLAFSGAEVVSYTNREGVKREVSLDEMTMILVNASGQGNLLSVGITSDDVKDMLVSEWNNQGGK